MMYGDDNESYAYIKAVPINFRQLSEPKEREKLTKT